MGRAADPLPLIGLIVMGLMVLLWIAGGFGVGGNGAVAVTGPGKTQPAAASPSVGPSPTVRPPPTARPTPTRTPEAKPQLTPGPTPSPTPSPTPTPSPMPSPTPSPLPTPTPGPTPPASGLIIIEPLDGSVVSVPAVRVAGLASPGSTITWDRPWWFDDHTTADSAGYWSFAISLGLGDNVMTFRVGDDSSTARTITVRYQP
jgi:hypothetical protein